jgi:PEP-CTERM motif-containing protein
MALPGVANATAATNLGGCSTSDTNPAAAACNGFYAGNQLGGSQDQTDTQAAALAALGFVGTVTQVEHIDLNGNSNVDFDTLLNGVTFIGIHWGAGQGPVDGPGGATGFYRLDLANDAQLDFFQTAFGSQSGAVLFKTGPCEGPGCDNTPGGDIPEPATWAMMIMGFGGVGALMRRRRGHLTAA